VWKSEVGDYYNMLCAYKGAKPWARYTSPDKSFQTWKLADPSFVKPAGVAVHSASGPLFNPIPKAAPGGPTHMINGNTGTAFFVGHYDPLLEVFNLSAPFLEEQYIDIGDPGHPFGHGSSHWAASSNDFEGGEVSAISE
jgi:hypothetical protein